MRYGFFFLFLSILLLYGVFCMGSWGWLLLWPTVSFGLVGAAYLGLGPRVFGKQKDGSISWTSRAFLFPYIALFYAVWYAHRTLFQEPAYHLLVENVWIGRRLFSEEYPEGIEWVIDLTCEFPASLPQGKSHYLSLPILDADIPEEKLLQKVLKGLPSGEQKIYIHCAQGRGRTALFACFFLLKKKIVSDPKAAIDFVQQRRPCVKLNKKQERYLFQK